MERPDITGARAIETMFLFPEKREELFLREPSEEMDECEGLWPTGCIVVRWGGGRGGSGGEEGVAARGEWRETRWWESWKFSKARERWGRVKRTAGGGVVEVGSLLMCEKWLFSCVRWWAGVALGNENVVALISARHNSTQKTSSAYQYVSAINISLFVPCFCLVFCRISAPPYEQNLP